MQTTKLSQEERVAFATALRKMGLERADNVVMDLSDMDDSDVPIAMSDLSKAIPERIRKQIVHLSKQRHTMLAEMMAVLDNLSNAGDNVVNKMETERLSKEPHCEKCGQLLIKTRKR